MIYLTVGTQLPFDRLVRTVDQWAERAKRTDVLAQIGESAYEPAAIAWTRFLTPQQSAEHIRSAEIIISHAGMGTIIAALEHGKPIVVFPRRGELGEQRSDHQLATARRFGERGLITVAEDEEALSRTLDSLNSIAVGAKLEPYASARLTAYLSRFLKLTYRPLDAEKKHSESGSEA